MLRNRMVGEITNPISLLLKFSLLTLLIASTAPAFAGPSIDDFIQPARIHGAELSPDGKHLAMIINEPSRRMVIVRNVEQPEMPLVGVYNVSVFQPSWFAWANNERLLLSIGLSFGMSKMVTMNVDMSDEVVLMEGERDLRRDYFLSEVTNYLPNDNEHILMAAYRGGKRSQYKVNIFNGEAEMVTKGSNRTVRFLNDDSGRPLYRFDFRDRRNTIELFSYENNDKWEEIDEIPLYRDEFGKFDSSELVALLDGDLVYRKRNEQSGFYELIQVNRSNKTHKVLAARPEQDIFGALFHPRSDQIIGYTIEKDNIRNVYFDESKQKQYDAITTSIGNNNVYVSSLDPGHERALVAVSGPDIPYDFYLWDYGTQKLTYLDSVYPELKPEELSKSASKTVTARDGTPLRTYLLLPMGFQKDKQYPTVILPHGGPHARSRPDYHFLAQFISTRGYIVVQPNFRGSVGFGRDFQESGYRQWGGLMQDDLTDVTNFMVENGYSDPERICIVGSSYGGYAALMGAIKTPELFACAVSMNGVTDLVDQVKHAKKELVDKDYWDDVLYARIGNPKTDTDMLRANSPVFHADKIKIPILLLAGEEDNRVPFTQSKKMAKALKKTGAEYEFIPFEYAGHDLTSQGSDRKTVMEALEHFLAKHLR